MTESLIWSIFFIALASFVSYHVGYGNGVRGATKDWKRIVSPQAKDEP